MISRCASRRWILLSCRRSTSLQTMQPRWKHASGSLLPPMSKPEEDSISNSNSNFLLLPPNEDSKLLDTSKTEAEAAPKNKTGVDRRNWWYEEGHAAPTYALNNRYSHSERRPEYNFTVYEGSTSIQWQTSTVTCPITGISMESGTLRGSDVDSKLVDGKVYYRNRKWAKRAASARLLDCIRYTETSELEPRLCEEMPIPLPIEVLQESLSKPPVQSSPKLALNSWFQEKGFRVVLGQGFSVKHTADGFVAFFTCPFTGHIVSSGTLMDRSSTRDVDGTVSYKSINDAQHAAAARFLDDLRYTQTGETEPRLCEETPAKIENIEKLLSEGDDKTNIGKSEKFTHFFKPSPMKSLQDMYVPMGFSRSQMNKGFVVHQVGKGYTASLKCPLTGHVVESGMLRNVRNFQVVDGKIVYRHEKTAEHAAAARLLDDLHYTRTGKVEPRRCEESPAIIEHYEEKWAKEASHCMNKAYWRFNVDGSKVQNGFSVSVTEDGFTCSFTCPITSHVVKAGRLKDKIDYKVLNGEVLYKEESDAISGAAGRLLDDLQYSLTGKLTPRLCEETPTAIKDFGLLLYRGAGPLLVKKDVYRKMNVTEIDSAVQSKLLQNGEWVATFTCPVTGHTVQGGILRGSGNARIVDNSVVYGNERGAKISAAAKFLDNLWYTQTGEREPRWCEEIPSRIHEDNVERLFFGEDRKKGYVIAVNAFNTISSQHPSGILNIIYSKLQAKLRSEDAFTPSQPCRAKKLKLRSEDAFTPSQPCRAKKWTGTFACPVTGYTVPAGTLRGSKDAKIIDGEVFYSGLVGARRASMARFLDSLRYTLTGKAEPRWCEEYPCRIEADNVKVLSFDSAIERIYVESLKGNMSSSIQEVPVSNRAPNGEDLVQIRSTLPSSMLGAAESDVAAGNADADAAGNADAVESVDAAENDTATALQQGGLSQWEQGTEDDDDFVIQDISSFRPSGTSTLDRIMDAWSETVTLHKSLPEGDTEMHIRNEMQASPSQQKEKMIADTVAWYNRLSKQIVSAETGYRIFQTATTPVTMVSATTALRALAKAHLSHPSEDLQTNKKVEAAAKQMIGLMWKIGKPSTAAYNSYIQCLAGSSAAETALAAEDMLRKMMERKKMGGHLLPEPNIGTFNAVIQLWSIVGGNSGYSKCEEIFDLIQRGADNGMDLRPNRDTFLSVLSSLARPSSANGTSLFNREQARGWIERMKQIGEETNDGTLVADTQVFNAPLRWSGTEASRSRPFAQPLPWDSYALTFENGFRPLKEDTPLWIEALRIEEWLLEMETIGPDPDVESYEAAIQAWVRTGMEDGLRRAELLAHRALRSDTIQTRKQTLYPMLAAWACSGDDRGLEKVEEWSSRFKDNGKTDQHFHLAKMIARRLMQKRAIARDGDEAIGKAAELAESCTHDLNQLISSAKVGDSQLNPASFLHTLRAWGDVALAKTPTDSTATSAEVESVIAIVKQFDDIVQHFRLKRDCETAGEDTEMQLQKLLQYSQTIYLNALTVLKELDRRCGGVRESSAFLKHIFAAESMLRRAQELRLVLSSSLNKANDDFAVSPDEILDTFQEFYPASISDYDFDKTYLEKQVALHSVIVDGCKCQMKNSDCFGDCVNLCMLVVDFMDQSASSQVLPSRQASVDCTDLYLDILKVIEAIPDEEERHEAIRRVFHSVNGIADSGQDESPFLCDKNAILSVLKGDVVPSTSSKGKRKGVRPRRVVKRQRWRSATRASFK